MSILKIENLNVSADNEILLDGLSFEIDEKGINQALLLQWQELCMMAY